MNRWGRTRAKLTQESEDTPLQEKLDVLASQIGQLGMGMAAATFVAMMTIWFLYPSSRQEGITVFDYMLKVPTPFPRDIVFWLTFVLSTGIYYGSDNCGGGGARGSSIGCDSLSCLQYPENDA
jgi:hypothetical protein